MTSSFTSDFREEVVRAVKARPTDRVLLAAGLSEALTLVADAAPGDVVTLDLTADLARTGGDDSRVVSASIDLVTTLAELERELERRSAALLIVPAVAGTTGEVLPLSALAGIAHRHGARLLVDGSELVSRRAINLTSHGIDYLVWSGPAGNGPAVVVGRDDWLIDVDGHPENVDINHADVLSRSFAPAVGYEWIGLHEQALSQWLDAETGRLRCVRRLRLWPDARDRVGITSLAVAGHTEPVVVRWDAATGIDELARQLNTLTENILEQEKS